MPPPCPPTRSPAPSPSPSSSRPTSTWARSSSAPPHKHEPTVPSTGFERGFARDRAELHHRAIASREIGSTAAAQGRRPRDASKPAVRTGLPRPLRPGERGGLLHDARLSGAGLGADVRTGRKGVWHDRLRDITTSGSRGGG